MSPFLPHFLSLPCASFLVPLLLSTQPHSISTNVVYALLLGLSHPTTTSSLIRYSRVAGDVMINPDVGSLCLGPNDASAIRPPHSYSSHHISQSTPYHPAIKLHIRIIPALSWPILPIVCVRPDACPLILPTPSHHPRSLAFMHSCILFFSPLISFSSRRLSGFCRPSLCTSYLISLSLFVVSFFLSSVTSTTTYPLISLTWNVILV